MGNPNKQRLGGVCSLLNFLFITMKIILSQALVLQFKNSWSRFFQIFGRELGVESKLLTESFKIVIPFQFLVQKSKLLVKKIMHPLQISIDKFLTQGKLELTLN
jgi:hypothetical protein